MAPLPPSGAQPHSADLLRLFIETAHDYALFMIDPAGLVVSWNPGAERITGYAGEEVVGREFSLFYPPEEAAAGRPRRELEQAAGVGSRRDEGWRLRKDGSRFWADVVLTPLPDQKGVLQGFAIVMRDLTERRRGEEALRASERRFRALIERAADAVALVNSDGTIVYESPAAGRILGHSPAERAGVNAFAFLHPDDLAHASELFGHLLHHPGASVTGEFRFRHNDGTYRWLEAAGTNLLAEPAVRAIVVNYRDITGRRQAEEEIRGLNAELGNRVTRRTAELEEAKSFLESLVAESPSLIFRADPDTTPTYVSPNIRRLLGYDPGEMVGVRGFWLDHVHPDEQEAFLAEFGDARARRLPRFEQEHRIRHKDGTYHWMYTLISLLYDEAGGPRSILGYALEISERRQAETAIRQAQLAAERASRAKSEFLSRMSHELRTPLNAVLGFAQLLQMDTLTPEQREAVDHILRSGHHLLELINEVLDISRIEVGRMQLAPEPVDLSSVLREATDMVRPLAAERGIQIDGLPAAAGRVVLADRQRLKQVLLNLLSNAVKYNRPGGRVEVLLSGGSAGRMRIAITDTGDGIPPERMAQLFLPFERLGAEQRGVEGTGIGLALSKRLVELMGGTIGAESTVGIGSRFWIEVPTQHAVWWPAALPEGSDPTAGSVRERR
jgi:PAS domain S-box-containing protein